MGDTKILVVEDQGFVSQFLKDLLEIWGFRSIEYAQNGREGVVKYLLFSADIVFMDVDMPVMNGYEACKSIKSRDPEANIILMTGRPADPWAIRALKEGLASTLLRKPFVFNELFKAIDSIRARSTPSSTPNESLGLIG